jgi:hypothetical protein
MKNPITYAGPLQQASDTTKRNHPTPDSYQHHMRFMVSSDVNVYADHRVVVIIAKN